MTAIGGAIININEELADREEAEQGVEVNTKETEGEKGEEVEGGKKVEAADGADETLP